MEVSLGSSNFLSNNNNVKSCYTQKLEEQAAVEELALRKLIKPVVYSQSPTLLLAEMITTTKEEYEETSAYTLARNLLIKEYESKKPVDNVSFLKSMLPKSISNYLQPTELPYEKAIEILSEEDFFKELPNLPSLEQALFLFPRVIKQIEKFIQQDENNMLSVCKKICEQRVKLLTEDQEDFTDFTTAELVENPCRFKPISPGQATMGQGSALKYLETQAKNNSIDIKSSGEVISQKPILDPFARTPITAIISDQQLKIRLAILNVIAGIQIQKEEEGKEDKDILLIQALKVYCLKLRVDIKDNILNFMRSTYAKVAETEYQKVDISKTLIKDHEILTTHNGIIPKFAKAFLSDFGPVLDKEAIDELSRYMQ